MKNQKVKLLLLTSIALIFTFCSKETITPNSKFSLAGVYKSDSIYAEISHVIDLQYSITFYIDSALTQQETSYTFELATPIEDCSSYINVYEPEIYRVYALNLDNCINLEFEDAHRFGIASGWITDYSFIGIKI